MRRFELPVLFGLVVAVAPPAPAAAQEVVPLPIKRPIRPLPGAPVGNTPDAPALSDEAALKEAGMSGSEAAPLLEYLKARTLTDTDQSRIGDIIKKFGSDDFDERLKATEEVERYGPAAIGPLKAAERDADPEVAYRARVALRRMEKVAHAQVSAAAVRAVAKLKPKDAAAVLVAFLPMADTEEVAEAVCTGLTALAATADGKPEPALVAALSDKLVARRAAAYGALIEGLDTAQLRAALPLVRAAVRKETDTDARFRGLWALLLTTREREFAPDLIEIIPKLPRGRIWQLEEFLLLLAGDTKPDARFGKTEEQLAKARDAWAAWWTKTGAGRDLAKFEFKPRVTGYTDILEYDQRGYGGYRVVTLGPDLKEKAKVTGTGINQLQLPMDARKMPNGHFLIAELNNSRVTERDTTGKILKTVNVAQPQNVDLLPEGGAVVVCRNQVIQYDKDLKQVWAYQRPAPGHDIICGRRLPGGDVVVFANTPQGSKCLRLAAKDGKEVGEAVTVGRVQHQQSPDATGDDKILVCEYNRVVEYELKTGKELWKYDANYPTSCQRLPNGNTLITLINAQPGGKVMEVEPNGDVVWEYAAKDGLNAARAYRR